jgi:hypothetical protein
VKAPNRKTCTEEELWKYVAFHLAAANIDCVLVGGAVVAIYSKAVFLKNCSSSKGVVLLTNLSTNAIMAL